ncbi:MAG: Gfo/Idh/MocA family oxidoreductase [Chloroflexi bacterium]|nr:Gfo/Idh/MocA family oxidoreductase [Chloroflexota bacterium]
MGDLRIGVIGAGSIGTVHAANLARRVPGARLAAVADVDREKAEACAVDNDVADAYISDTELLAHPDIAAVIVCTPPETHAGIIEAAAAAGKHVFCEKPLERTLERADAALAAVEKAGVKFFIGLNRRYDPHFLRLRDAVYAGEAGCPLAVHFIARDPVEALADSPNPPGDLFFSTTVHELDFAGVVMRSPVESVYAAGGVMAEGGGPVIDEPDTAITLLRFAGGALVTIDNSRVAPGYDQRIEVFGTSGVVTADNLRADDAVAIGGAMSFFTKRYGESYIAEMRAFVDCVRRDTPSPVGPKEARASQVLAEAAWQSYREERPVAVREIG